MRIDIGLLFLRVATGSFILIGHGLVKLFKFSDLADQFSDPLGLGPTLSLTAAIFAEVLCAMAVILGVFTRLATIPLVFTMLVAAGLVHAEDPWGKKEFALLYAVPFTTLMITGPGRLTLERFWRKSQSH